MRRLSPHITQSQIARKAGVSQATVSAILSGSSLLNVGEETRAAVMAIAEKSGYMTRKTSRKNVEGTSGKQNVFLVEGMPISSQTNEPWIEEAYEALMGKLFSTVSRQLQENGTGMSVYHLDKAQDLMRWLAEANVGGVLWHAKESDLTLLHWVATHYPFVLLNREWKTTLPIDSVSVDQEKLLLLAVEYLWELGHRRIALFGHNASSVSQRRLVAYHRFVEERGLRNYSEFQEISDAPEIAALAKVSEIISTWKRLGNKAPTALIASDVFILPLLREARKVGIRIPEDLSVIGTNNMTPCALVDPAVTAIDEPFEEMCCVAVDLLMRRKANPEESPRTVQIAPRLIKRGSVLSISGKKSGAKTVSITT